MPVKRPWGFKDSQPGSAPPKAESTIGPVPPDALTDAAYCAVDVVAGSGPGEMETGGSTSNNNAACAVAPAASVTVAVKLMVAGGVPMGCPANRQLELSATPEPVSPAAVQANGLVPPVTLNAYE